MTWLMLLIALYGTVLNIKRKASGFILWAISNVYWSIHNVLINENALAVQFCVYFGLSVWGYWKWTRENLSQAKQNSAS